MSIETLLVGFLAQKLTLLQVFLSLNLYVCNGPYVHYDSLIHIQICLPQAALIQTGYLLCGHVCGCADFNVTTCPAISLLTFLTQTK